MELVPLDDRIVVEMNVAKKESTGGIIIPTASIRAFAWPCLPVLLMSIFLTVYGSFSRRIFVPTLASVALIIFKIII